MWYRNSRSYLFPLRTIPHSLRHLYSLISNVIYQEEYSRYSFVNSLEGDNYTTAGAHCSSPLLCIEGRGALRALSAPSYALACGRSREAFFSLQGSHYRDILRDTGVFLLWAGPLVYTFQADFLRTRAEYYSSKISEKSENAMQHCAGFIDGTLI
jgi:hypothetical protein